MHLYCGRIKSATCFASRSLLPRHCIEARSKGTTGAEVQAEVTNERAFTLIPRVSFAQVVRLFHSQRSQRPVLTCVLSMSQPPYLAPGHVSAHSNHWARTGHNLAQVPPLGNFSVCCGQALASCFVFRLLRLGDTGAPFSIERITTAYWLQVVADPRHAASSAIHYCQPRLT